jgi:NADH:ubiquinone oxidoreductase subunit F (NADH-binding)
MPVVEEPRVLDHEAVVDLGEYSDAGEGLRTADRSGSATVIAVLRDSKLRGRGGAGFPTGLKWQTVVENRSAREPATVVVNGAEGEPGTFKDRAILLTNPYRVLEGAVIAARTVGADRIVVALKESFTAVAERVRRAIAEIEQAGWTAGLVVDVMLGPSSYLFGEETALLEVVNGRPPFPQVSPPYRRGVDVVSANPTAEAAVVELAGPADRIAAPTLVDNVETLANVPAIVARGARWFRSVGTEGSPGTVTCTISGDTRRAGVAEVPLGMTLREAIALIGRGLPDGRTVKLVLPGVSAGVVLEHNLDVPLAHEPMREIGSGLGTAGFIVFDDRADTVAVAEAVARFLAIESCGQCTPCKGDGLELLARLERMRRGAAEPDDVPAVAKLASHVDLGARCFLGQQHREVVESLLLLELDDFERHGEPADAAPPVLIAPMVDLDDGVAVLDEDQRSKNPDWSYGGDESGQWPAARLDVDAEAD